MITVNLYFARSIRVGMLFISLYSYFVFFN